MERWKNGLGLWTREGRDACVGVFRLMQTVITVFATLSYLLGFSLRTPLKGSPSAFWSMKRPVPESRLVQTWLVGLNACERSFTAPTRALSPTGLFFAMGHFRKYDLRMLQDHFDDVKLAF